MKKVYKLVHKVQTKTSRKKIKVCIVRAKDLGRGIQKLTEKGVKKQPRQKIRKRDGIPSKVFEEILQSLDQKTFVGKRNTLVFSLLYATGMRLNELMHFRYEN